MGSICGFLGPRIYRSGAPTGPWTLIGSNVVDMDAGAANNQYVDQTGDVGGPWFYEIAANNGGCGAVGPYGSFSLTASKTGRSRGASFLS